MNKIQILFLSVLGISILISYYIVLGKWSKQSDSYTTHPFWFGLDKNIVKILTIFQLLAVIGFLTGTISWLKNPPKEGIMSRQNILFLTIAVFFLSAALWPYTTYYKKVWLTVSVLIITAISCILLLAGCKCAYKNVGFVFMFIDNDGDELLDDVYVSYSCVCVCVYVSE